MGQAIYCRFTDSTEVTIAQVFDSDQSGNDSLADTGSVDAADARYVVFYTALPTAFQGALPAPDFTAADLLSVAQTTQAAVLYAACEAAIESGFTSFALGSKYTYPSAIRDQLNLRHVADSASGGALWCASGSTWAHSEHTQAQAQTVSESFVTWLNACQTQLLALTSEVDDATTVDAVNAITWVSPTVLADETADASGVDASGITSIDAFGS